jgi:SAM-dependent methyltransferase
MPEEAEHSTAVASPQSVESASRVVLKLERISCPLCGSSSSSVVMTSRDYLCGLAGEFHVERCHACGHRFMNPRPVSDSLGACYPEQYGPHQSVPQTAAGSGAVAKSVTTAKSGSSSVRRPKYLRILPLRYVPGLKHFYNWLMDDRSQPVPTPQTVIKEGAHSVRTAGSDKIKPRALELGCATGQYLVRLQEAGWSATGIEPGERPSSIARAAGLDVQCGTLEAAELQPEQFELATAWMVIEHVPDARETLRRLHSILKPGGTLLFSIPNAGCWEAWFFGKYWYVWELPRHLHHFTPASIRRLLQECGFTEITIIYQRNLSYVVGSLALSILARWPESRLGHRLLRYPDRPTMMTKLLLSPFAHILAWMRQGGRLTISARRGTSGRDL